MALRSMAKAWQEFCGETGRLPESSASDEMRKIVPLMAR